MFRSVLRLASLFGAVSAGLYSPCAMAVPLTWYLQNVVVVTGEVATGSFDYDADTNTLSNVNIAVTGARPGPYNLGVFSTGAVVLAAETPTAIGKFSFAISSVAARTNAGGTIALNTGVLQGGFYNCVNAGCTLTAGSEVVGSAQIRPGGSITTLAPVATAALPVPGLSGYGLAALGAALAAFGLRRIRRNRG